MGIDGALRADHRVSAYAADVLHRLDDVGVPTIVGTGRTEHAALQVCHQGRLRVPSISSNGTHLPDSDLIIGRGR